MKVYIGTKLIKATPQVKDGKEGYKVIYDNGHESWSPKEVFESAYREVSNTEKELFFEKDSCEK